MITNTDLEGLRLVASRATQLALDAREDRSRAERTLEVLRYKEDNLAREAQRAALEYASAIQSAARRLAS